MELIIDAGNTNIKYALIDQGKIVRTHRFKSASDSAFAVERKVFLKDIDIKSIDGIIFSSVVPSLNERILDSFRDIPVEPFIINGHVKSHIKMSETIMDEMGADLMCVCEAAYQLNGKKAVMALSLGTASVLLVIGDDGSLLNSLIYPGLVSGSSSLFGNTELLESVELNAVDNLVAHNTKEALLSGIVFSYIGALKYLIRENEEYFGRDFRVYACGGIAHVIGDKVEEIDIYDDDLIYKGAMMLWEMNR